MTVDLYAGVRRESQHRPFPLAPLLEHVRHAHLSTITNPDAYRRALAGGGASALSNVLHVSGSRARCWADHGLTAWEADRAAVRLGHHPCEVWPDWFDRALDDDAIDTVVERHHARIARLARSVA